MINTIIGKKINHFFGQRLYQSLAVLICTATGIAVIQDYLRSILNHSAFYLSESVLYTAFWWVFLPVLLLMHMVFRKCNNRITFSGITLMVVSAVVLHLLLSSFLIWILSVICFDHTYAFAGVCSYTIAEQLYILLGLYAAGVLFFRITGKPVTTIEATVDIPRPDHAARQLKVTNGKTNMLVDTCDIHYISAATPYVTLHLGNRKLLYTQTLKSIQAVLDPAQFIRVHKSTIVNVSRVVSFTSRLNGDYDLLLENGEIIRLSRNYWPSFKARF